MNTFKLTVIGLSMLSAVSSSVMASQQPLSRNELCKVAATLALDCVAQNALTMGKFCVNTCEAFPDELKACVEKSNNLNDFVAGIMSQSAEDYDKFAQNRKAYIGSLMQSGDFKSVISKLSSADFLQNINELIDCLMKIRIENFRAKGLDCSVPKALEIQWRPLEYISKQIGKDKHIWDNSVEMPYIKFKIEGFKGDFFSPVAPFEFDNPKVAINELKNNIGGARLKVTTWKLVQDINLAEHYMLKKAFWETKSPEILKLLQDIDEEKFK